MGYTVCPQRGNVFSLSTFERYSRTSGQALCHLPTAAALRFWSGGAVLSHARFGMLSIAIFSLFHLDAAYVPSGSHRREVRGVLLVPCGRCDLPPRIVGCNERTAYNNST